MRIRRDGAAPDRMTRGMRVRSGGKTEERDDTASVRVSDASLLVGPV